MAVARAELYDPRLGTWSSTAAMSTARVPHTATLLTDGRVARQRRYDSIYDSFSRLASAEIYDPARGTWSPTGSMGASRYDHTATLLRDGRVLVSGGPRRLQPWERGNLRSGAGHLVADPFDEHGAGYAHGHAAARRPGARQRRAIRHDQHHSQRRDLRSGAGHLVADGLDDCGPNRAHRHLACRRPGARQRGLRHIYDTTTTMASVSIRQSSYWQSAEIYDPVSGTWSRDRLDARRHRYSIPARCYQTAGCSSAAVNLLLLRPFVASAEIYDPATGTWSPTAVMSTPRRAYTATLLPDGRVLVSGGSGAAP